MFHELKSHHIPEVIQISNQVFGSNFISPNELKKYCGSTSKKAFIIVKKKLILGFITIEILSLKKLHQVILKENEWFINLCKPHKIALIKQVVVVSSEQKKGFGSQLVKYAKEQTINDVDMFLCLGWTKNHTIPIEKALLNNHFFKETVIQNYWEADSLKKKYNCIVCGKPPCKCDATVYLMHKKTD